MDFYGRLPKVQQNNQLNAVMTDRYSKLTSAIPASEMASTHMADVFLDKWLAPFGISEFVLGDYDLQFVSKFLAMLCAELRAKHLTTTTFYPQTNGKAEIAIAQ